MDFETMNRVDVKSVCLTRLLIMGVLLGMNCTNPLDKGPSPVTKNWTCFIKMHLKRPHVDGMALLQGTCVFVLELEGDEKVLEKVEKGYELVSLPVTSVYTSKENH